jgi:hypothetical protein
MTTDQCQAINGRPNPSETDVKKLSNFFLNLLPK